MRAAGRHRGAWWTAVVAALLALGGGIAIAAFGYASSSGAQGAVRGYFAALARADAPAALGYGDIPDGSRALLTSAVLREQQHIARIGEVQVGALRTAPAGSSGRVAVSYRLHFADTVVRVSDSVPVRQVDSDWRLERVAVSTQLLVSSAAPRATILGHALPAGSALIFPGATPVDFDTGYLRPAPARDHVGFDALPSTQLVTELTQAGRAAVLGAATSQLRDCLDGRSSDARCPLPSERYVPGRLRGRLVGVLGPQVTLSVGTSDAGRVVLDGLVRIEASYRRLSFRNQIESGRGRLSLPLHGATYLTGRPHLLWDRA